MNGAWLICPKCKSTSIEVDSQGYVTCLGSIPYKDKNGENHYHDHNSTTKSAICENGHILRAIIYQQCWCGWRKEDNKLLFLEADQKHE